MAVLQPYALPHPGPPPEPPELPEGAPRPARRLATDVTPWPAWTSIAALLAALGTAFTVGAVVLLGITAAVGGDFEDPPPGGVIAATLFQDACLIGFAVLFARMTGRASAWHFGIRRPRIWRSVGLVPAGYLVFLLLTGAWLAVMQSLGVDIDQDTDLPDELGADEGTVALIVVGLLVTVVAPIAEEFFFRGFFFTALRRWKGIPLATLLTGAAFGAIHVGSSPAVFLVPLAIFGAVLCLVYWLADSLLPCVALHAINNSVAFGVSQDWGWQIPLVMLGALAISVAVLAPFIGRGAPGPRTA